MYPLGHSKSPAFALRPHYRIGIRGVKQVNLPLIIERILETFIEILPPRYVVEIPVVTLIMKISYSNTIQIILSLPAISSSFPDGSAIFWETIASRH
jgi:hypothetical protein